MMKSILALLPLLIGLSFPATSMAEDTCRMRIWVYENGVFASSFLKGTYLDEDILKMRNIVSTDYNTRIQVGDYFVEAHFKRNVRPKTREEGNKYYYQYDMVFVAKKLIKLGEFSEDVKLTRKIVIDKEFDDYGAIRKVLAVNIPSCRELSSN